MPEQNSKQDFVMISLFLIFIFALTMAGHFLYVRGYGGQIAAAIGWERSGSHIALQPYPYKSQEECEHVNGTRCVLEICDFLPALDSEMEACRNRDKKGWVPIAE